MGVSTVILRQVGPVLAPGQPCPRSLRNPQRRGTVYARILLWTSTCGPAAFDGAIPGGGNAMSCDCDNVIYIRISSSSEQRDSPPALAAWRPAGVACNTKGGCTYVHRHDFTRAL